MLANYLIKGAQMLGDFLSTMKSSTFQVRNDQVPLGQLVEKVGLLSFYHLVTLWTLYASKCH